MFSPSVQHSQAHPSQNNSTIKKGTSRYTIYPHNHGIQCSTLYDQKEFEEFETALKGVPAII